MKIGIEGTTLGAKITGTNRYLSCLLEQLEDTGNEIVTFDSTVNYLPERIGKKFYRTFSLKKEMLRCGIDCAIFPDYYMPGDFRKPSAIIIHDLSFISHPHFYPKKFIAYYNYKIKETLRQSPIIVAVSEHTRRSIGKYLCIKEENVFLLQGYSKLYNNNQSLNGRKKEGKPYFLFVGHLEPRKNLDFLIEGFLRWKEKQFVDYKLKIVGELWIKSLSVLKMLEKYKGHSDIEFTGYVTDGELVNIYEDASAFLHTSFEEGFGFPVLEAMHYNLPIICTRDIATEEISKPKSIAIEPHNSLSYYKGLEKLSSLIESNEKVNYNIKYSPQLMKRQLGKLLDTLEMKVKKQQWICIPAAKNHREALEKTLIYSSIFNTGIRQEKLHEQVFDLKIGPEELQSVVSYLNSIGITNQSAGFIYLKDAEEGYYKRDKKRIDKLKLIKLLHFLNKIPFVSTIAFSGGTTHYGAENHDDLDLFIITKPYIVYLVYFLIHTYSLLFNVRKELCANYLIDETDLEITHSYDLYTAHQIISLQAFKGHKILNKFFEINGWVKNYFPNFNIRKTDYNKPSKFYYLFKPVNKILQYSYRKLYSKQLEKFESNNSLKLNEHCIKLHTNDHKTKVIHEFENAWLNYYKNKELINNISEEDNRNSFKVSLEKYFVKQAIKQ